MIFQFIGRCLRRPVSLVTRWKLGPWLIGVALIAFFASNYSDPQKAAEERRQAEAQRIAAETPAQREAELDAKDGPAARLECRQAVEHQLHDPGSADLDNYTRYVTTKIGSGNYHVIVTGRAKNGFGAMRRITVTCQAQRFGSSWSTSSIQQIL